MPAAVAGETSDRNTTRLWPKSPAEKHDTVNSGPESLSALITAYVVNHAYKDNQRLLKNKFLEAKRTVWAKYCLYPVYFFNFQKKIS